MFRHRACLVLALAFLVTLSTPIGVRSRSLVEPGAAAAPVLLNTFIPYSIQIDQLFDPPNLAADDANLFLGNDPADGSPSFAKPLGDPRQYYIDWTNLGTDPTSRGPSLNDLANHQLMDAYGGKDPSSFPRSNECIGSSNVPGKADLTYVALATNTSYAYFAVQRANNDGDAAYYWLFTKRQPRLSPGEAPCKADEFRLLYDLSTGDILLGGHFHPNADPLLRVWVATSDQGLTAVDAIDFMNSLWLENLGAVAAVAVNTTPTAAGSLGAVGVTATSVSAGYPTVEPEIFAEAAVPLSTFGTNGVGTLFYGTVITRASGSGGTSPDLKDFAGPVGFFIPQGSR